MDVSRIIYMILGTGAFDDPKNLAGGVKDDRPHNEGYRVTDVTI